MTHEHYEGMQEDAAIRKGRTEGPSLTFILAIGLFLLCVIGIAIRAFGPSRGPDATIDPCAPDEWTVYTVYELDSDPNALYVLHDGVKTRYAPEAPLPANVPMKSGNEPIVQLRLSLEDNLQRLDSHVRDLESRVRKLEGE